jgi:radical SAM protein with 4Fe4S-binding SPASM domain
MFNPFDFFGYFNVGQGSQPRRKERTVPELSIRNIVVGTTGMCNASCVHCPTNKLQTEHLARAPMPMDLFKRLVSQLAAPAVEITGFFSFGLFGDSLIDPHVVARVQYLKEKLPGVFFHLNTNGAAYNRAKHKSLVGLVDLMSIHIESLDEELYDELMTPLRLKNVRPKIEWLCEDFGDRVYVSCPVNRNNRSERERILDFFEARGGGTVFFAPLSNRCSPSPVFDGLAQSPEPGSCRSDILDDLIVDWTGEVFACCNDFSKELPLGHIGQQSLVEVMRSRARKEMARKLDCGAWVDLKTCSKCSFDKAEGDVSYQLPRQPGSN